MDEIGLIPDPSGRWVMMCPCGASEIRAESGPAWRDFRLKALTPEHYQVTCRICGQTTDQLVLQEEDGEAATFK